MESKGPKQPCLCSSAQVSTPPNTTVERIHDGGRNSQASIDLMYDTPLSCLECFLSSAIAIEICPKSSASYWPYTSQVSIYKFNHTLSIHCTVSIMIFCLTYPKSMNEKLLVYVFRKFLSISLKFIV